MRENEIQLPLMKHYFLLLLFCVCALAQGTGYVPLPNCDKQKTKQDCQLANCAWCATTEVCAHWNACKHEPRGQVQPICTYRDAKHYGWNVDAVTSCRTITAWIIIMYIAFGLCVVACGVWIVLAFIACIRKRSVYAVLE